MQYFQILDCNDTLGTCCNDYGLVSVLDIARKFINLLQIIVPILLIIFSCYQFIRLMANPEEKNGLKKVYNKYIAALVVFILPIIINAVLGMMPESFEVAACWEEAKISAEVVRSQKNTYISSSDKTSSPFYKSSEYEGGDGSSSSSSSSSASVTMGTGEGSTTGKAIVAYAKQFVGKQYKYGGTWNGELPYTPTDCSGFVQGVFKHFGISLSRTTTSQWADKSKFTLVTSGSIKAGDLVMYDGHVAILTGSGNQIVHAQSTKTGVVISSDYKSSSSHAILGIMRINGVN
jgi:cell wall-associated NlpC family hydrolase